MSILELYRSSTADWNYHQKMMIANFETEYLHKKMILGMVKSDFDALAPCVLKSSESFLCYNQF